MLSSGWLEAKPITPSPLRRCARAMPVLNLLMGQAFAEVKVAGSELMSMFVHMQSTRARATPGAWQSCWTRR